MSDTDDVSDLPVLQSHTEIGKSEGRNLAVNLEYLRRLDGLEDFWAGADMRVARGIGELLNKFYFGYEWKSFADCRAGVVGFQIPDLMGPTLHMVVNLKTHSDLTPELIVDKGGELLERMNLPRDKFSMYSLLEARQRKPTFDFGKVQ